VHWKLQGESSKQASIFLTVKIGACDNGIIEIRASQVSVPANKRKAEYNAFYAAADACD